MTKFPPRRVTAEDVQGTWDEIERHLTEELDECLLKFVTECCVRAERDRFYRRESIRHVTSDEIPVCRDPERHAPDCQCATL